MIHQKFIGLTRATQFLFLISQIYWGVVGIKDVEPIIRK